MEDKPVDLRRITSARTLLLAGADEYRKAIETGRIAAWGKMMHSIIDLLMEPSATHPKEDTNEDA